MKVVVCCSTFPAHDDDPVPRFVYDQVLALKKIHTDLEITVLAPHNTYSRTLSQKHKEFEEVRFHYFWPKRFEKLAGRGIDASLKENPWLYLLVPFFIISMFFNLLAITRRQKPDYLYAHWFMPQGLVAALVSKVTGTPWILTSHASDVSIMKKVPLGKYLTRKLLPTASKITAVSTMTKERMKGFFSEEAWEEKIVPKFSIIPMGVHLPYRNNNVTSKEANNILFIGRLVEKKGIKYLISAIKEVRQSFPDINLTVAGDGPLLEELREQVTSLGLGDSIKFAGYVNGGDKDALIKQSDILVVPSIITKSGDAEGMPVVVLEALAYGKICIATKDSGASDCIKDGKDGLIIESGNIDAIVDALTAVLQKSGKSLATMRTNALASSARFSWSSIAKKHYNFFWGTKS